MIQLHAMWECVEHGGDVLVSLLRVGHDWEDSVTATNIVDTLSQLLFVSTGLWEPVVFISPTPG